jgi:hypothetical protein
VTTERVAAKQATEGEPGCAKRVVQAVGLERVVRAGGGEAAVAAEEGAEENLVRADREDEGE